ncbi:MAG: PTS IIA-like nitrogen regulatory protein PtsN [Pseudomonadota bacterium]
MGIAAFLSADAVFTGVDAHSKKHAIQELSHLAARLTKLPEREIFDTLLQRERLGSTGVGNGVAIPHGKLVALDHLVGLFARLATPISFDALDDAPVDLVFVLLAPEDGGADHLKALAKIARVMRTADVATELREAPGRIDIHRILTRTPVSAA